MPIKIGETSKIYDQSMIKWRLPIALMAGLHEMRNHSSEFLPRYSKETGADYAVRVRLCNLYNVFRRTVRSLSSKPFKKPPQLLKIPEQLKLIENDVDRDGQKLTQFCRELMSALLTFGLTHVLTDMPQFGDGVSTLTLKDERLLNVHPYFVHIRPDSLIYWSYVNGVTGDSVLSEIHYRLEEIDENNEEWSKIIVWTRDSIQHWRRKKDAKQETEYALESDVPNALGRIPLTTIYADVSKRGLMVGDSPLEDLADLNLRHFRSQSDQDTCLHFARVPFLHFAGFQASEVEKTVSVNNAYISANPQSKIEWIETSGTALEIGQKDLDSLESRMESMGADLLVQKPGNPTATAKSIDSAEKISDLQAMTQALEDGLVEMYEDAAAWVSLNEPGIEIELFKNFGLSLKDKAEIDVLLKARIAGEISRETWLAELSRRGLLEDLDIDEELNRLAMADDEPVDPEPA